MNFGGGLEFALWGPSKVCFSTPKLGGSGGMPPRKILSSHESNCGAFWAVCSSSTFQNKIVFVNRQNIPKT